MKAVIMAGGEGTRLRPLTCTIPKPMARLFGRPIIEYILDLLYANSADEAMITLGYMPQAIERRFEGGYRGMKLGFVREDEPLGTAGSVKNAACGYNEPFIVVSGDAVCSFELSKIMEYHKAREAAVTIVGCRAGDPREYGVIKVDDGNRVIGFVEKPSWSQAVSNLINTGIYVINPECLELVPSGKTFDFAKDLFPCMLEKGMSLYCYNADGYWCDIGSIEAYLGCHSDVFDGKADILGRSVANGIYVPESLPHGNYSLVPPVYIGKDTEISDGAVIGPYTVLDDSVFVGKNAKIRNSVVLENSSVAANAALTGALICSGVSVKSAAAMFEQSVAGSGSVIGANAQIKPGVLIWPGKIIGAGASVSSNVKYGFVRADYLDDKGVCESAGAQLNAETCVRLGAAVGSTRAGKKAGVAFDGSNSANAMYISLIGGLMSAGSHVWDFSDCFEAQLNFFVNFCGLGTGLFANAGDERAIHICGEGGLSITRHFERDIESRMEKCEFHRACEDEIREYADMSAVRTLYKQELIRQAPCGLGGTGACVVSSNESIEFLMRDTLKKLGAVGEKSPLFNINSSGTNVSAVLESGESIGYEQLLAVCCLNEMQNGRDVSVPYDAPQLLDELASEHGRQVYRYLSSPADDSDSTARRLAAKQMYVRDALFLTVKVLSIMNERDASLEYLLSELPEVFFVKREMPLNISPSRLSQLIGEEKSESGNSREGIRLVRDNGRLLIVPERSGEKVRILAEAASAETARELCESVEELIAAAENTDKSE